MRRIFILLLIAAGCTILCPAATALAFDLNDVYVTVSDNDLDDSTRVLIDYDDLIDLFSNYNNMTGVIPSQYMDYLRSCLSRATLNDHYVAFVSNYTVNGLVRVYYVIAIGDISINGSTFTGSGVDVYEFFPNVDSFNGYSNYRYFLQRSFSFTSSGGLVFTDLSSSYPDLRTISDRYLFVALTVLALSVTFYTFTKFGWHNLRRRQVLK